MKRWITFILALIMSGTLIGCTESKQILRADPAVPSVGQQDLEDTCEAVDIPMEQEERPERETGDSPMYDMTLQLHVNGTPVSVSWEENKAVGELMALAAKDTITVETSAYGGFERVGTLTASLTRNDIQMTTIPGDIVLYTGNQLVLFYGSNTWNYTKLGHIEEMTDRELIELLDRDLVTVELSIR